jgi:hypothetical protein
MRGKGASGWRSLLHFRRRSAGERNGDAPIVRVAPLRSSSPDASSVADAIVERLPVPA